MSNHKRHIRRTALSAAVLAALFGLPAFAQEQATDQVEDASLMEEVTVTGIRRSIARSIDDKRFADNVIDTINAEDIGKSTDQNIADALSRVTGVTALSQDGEGTQITIRGANPQLNIVSMNGVQLGSTDFSQGTDLSQFSADILSKVEVIKTSSAEHEEGALGGVVNLITPKPLEMPEEIRRLDLQYRYNDLAEENDYKVSGSWSEKLFDDSLGLMLTAFSETYTVRRDQYRAENFSARYSRIARDVDGSIINDTTGIAPLFTNNELFINERNRLGVNFDAQWMISDSSELTLHASWNKQEIYNQMHGARGRIGDYGNHFEGEAIPGMGMPESTWTDPQEDWHTYDPSTRTWVKMVNRMALGDLSQSEDKYDNENTIYKLDWRQDFGDKLTMNLGASYSMAERIPDQSVYVNLQNYARINAWLLWHTPAEDMEPVGYDCTSGPCRIVYGEGFIDYGELVDPLPNNGHLWDNRSTTGFNPDELDAQHLSYLQRNVVAVEDEISSAYFDFDWDIEFAGINQVEFGARYSEREKYVDNQAGTFNSVGEGVVVINPDTGNPMVIQNGLSDIQASWFATGKPFPADDFMKSLGYGRDNVTDGWTTFSAFEAFNIALGSPDVEFTPDNTETRSATLENTAAYMQFNFSYLDERLTGNVGVRYVTTDVETTGYSGVNFHFDPGNVGRVFDPFHMQQVRDDSLPLCPGIIFYGTDWNAETRWSRPDGTGYDTMGTLDYRDDVLIPDAGPCHDPRANPDHVEFGEWWLWRHSDNSTERFWVYGERQFDENGNLVATDDRSRRAFPVSGEHSYSETLPSLNLNYLLSEEWILRFAASKTMSRPQIDSLRPGFKVTETVWGEDNPRAGNTITLYNSTLDPLESNNLDFSAEWYFDDDALLSIGVFYKDMTNFEESEQLITYMDDLRDLGLDPDAPPYDVNDLLKSANDLEGCMPRRYQGNHSYNWIYSGDPEQMCAKFTTTRIRNGKGAEVLGTELQYTQTYTDLPGFWSGLGVMMNYTYTDSSYDQEVSSIDPDVKLPELPVAYTPEHSYNATVFWGMDGHQLRLAWQGSEDVLVQRAWSNGSLWQEGRNTLDFSAVYQVSDWAWLTFDAVNLTDEGYRTYWTSRFLYLGDTDAEGNAIPYDEGSPLDGNATKSRTVVHYKTGTIYRLGFNMRF